MLGVLLPHLLRLKVQLLTRIVVLLQLYTHTHTYVRIPSINLSIYPSTYTHTHTHTNTHTHTHTHTHIIHLFSVHGFKLLEFPSILLVLGLNSLHLCEGRAAWTSAGVVISFEWKHHGRWSLRGFCYRLKLFCENAHVRQTTARKNTVSKVS